jgi:hypothetical protein
MRSARHAIRLALECRSWKYASGDSQWHEPGARLDLFGNINGLSVPEVRTCKLRTLIH